jgi:flavin-dependent dehydrogenase
VHCTGVLAAEAFEEFGLDRSSILNPLTTVRFFSPASRSISYTASRLEAVAIDRLLFDQRLFDTARASGAAMALGHRVEDVSVEDEGVRLRFKEGSESRARLCVLACGANTDPAAARPRPRCSCSRRSSSCRPAVSATS